MDTPQMISLDDVVLRDDLDPRLGERDDNLIAQYADIFDALPPIEINQYNELIDGWHRWLAAEDAGRGEIACVVVETENDDDLSDKMWAANLKHGVQYTRIQRQMQGRKLHQRKLSAKKIADRVGVSAATVRRWTKDQRERDKQQRNVTVIELAEQGKTQAQIAEETGVPQTTVSDILTENVQMREIGKDVVGKEPPTEQPALESSSADPRSVSLSAEAPAELVLKSELVEETSNISESELETDEASVDEQPDISELGSQPETDGTLAVEEEPATPDSEPEPPPPEPIPIQILNTARAIMGTFGETRPDDYVARFEVSPSEWMTITDDSLSNELERELLTTAAAMCLWQEWMIWYQGERTSAFTDAFGKIGTVFVRGQAGQWRIVSRLRSILRRLWA